MDNLLSTEGLEEGGGILMLERSAEALVVSAWEGFRMSEVLIGPVANREWVEVVLPGTR